MHWIYTQLICPQCHNSLEIDMICMSGHHTEKIQEGFLTCVACSNTYPIINEIPRLLCNASELFSSFYKKHKKPLAHATKDMRSFQRVKKAYEHWNNNLLAPIIYDQFPIEHYLIQSKLISTEQLKDKIVLDAGCGHASALQVYTHLGAKCVIGVDIGNSLDLANRHYSEMPHIFLIQANLFALPFPQDFFDCIISQGVLHHTPNPRKAFHHLVCLLKVHGQLSVYLYWQGRQDYHKRPQQTLRMIVHYFFIEPFRRGLTYLPHSFLLLFSYMLYYLKCFFETLSHIPILSLFNQLLTKIIKYDLREGKARYISRCYDSLSTPYLHNHNQEEIIQWFIQEQFDNILVGPYPICINATKITAQMNHAHVKYYAPQDLPLRLKSRQEAI